MNLHVLYNGGDGTYDVVNITDTGEVEYISTEFMDGQHATAYIAGWHDAKASVEQPAEEDPGDTRFYIGDQVHHLESGLSGVVTGYWADDFPDFRGNEPLNVAYPYYAQLEGRTETLYGVREFVRLSGNNLNDALNRRAD